jgi:hypothetical protein
LQNKKPREGEEDPELVEEIRVARQNLGRYTRKISQEYEEESAVRMEDLRQSLISLLNVVSAWHAIFSYSSFDLITPESLLLCFLHYLIFRLNAKKKSLTARFCQ